MTAGSCSSHPRRLIASVSWSDPSKDARFLASSGGLSTPGCARPASRAELLHVLMLPDFERAKPIDEFWSYPESRTFAELLIDCEEDRVLRAVLLGMLREGN
jgi:hypothetical protein